MPDIGDFIRQSQWTAYKIGRCVAGFIWDFGNECQYKLAEHGNKHKEGALMWEREKWMKWAPCLPVSWNDWSFKVFLQLSPLVREFSMAANDILYM